MISELVSGGQPLLEKPRFAWTLQVLPRHESHGLNPMLGERRQEIARDAFALGGIAMLAGGGDRQIVDGDEKRPQRSACRGTDRLRCRERCGEARGEAESTHTKLSHRQDHPSRGIGAGV